MGMYKVCAKCGHVGRNYYVDKIFAVEASSGKEAAAKVRSFPRVKHDHKDAIRYVEPIDATQYVEIVSGNHLDPFFFCRNVQEQRQKCGTALEIHYDMEVRKFRKKKTEPRQSRPKERIKRASCSEILYCYYSEVGTLC